jgi:plastocyanin
VACGGRGGGDSVAARAAADQPVHEIQIVAIQYAFEPATIAVTAGGSVRLVIRSTGRRAWVLDFRPEHRGANPGRRQPVTVECVAPTPGRYDIACSEYRGTGHGQMKTSLVSVARGADVAAVVVAADEDLNLRPAEPDFTLVALPTALRARRHESAFRVTHWFTQLNASVGESDRSPRIGGRNWYPGFNISPKFLLTSDRQLGAGTTPFLHRP